MWMYFEHPSCIQLVLKFCWAGGKVPAPVLYGKLVMMGIRREFANELCQFPI